MSPRFPQYFAALAAALLVVSSLVGATGATTAASDASFQKNVIYEQQGDVVTVTVNADAAATVNLGSPEQGFWMQVGVGQGTTTLHLNTYKAGDTQYGRNEMVRASEGGIRSLDLRTDPIDAPLDTARYSMNVTVNGVEQDIGAFVVEERATNDISARLAPRDTKVGELEPEDVTDATTPLPHNGTVARGDWLVLHVDATGLDGILSKSILDGDRYGVAVSFDQSNRHMNVDPNEFDGSKVERVISGPDGDGAYLFVDTDDNGMAPGHRYNVTFSVAADSPLADEREAVSTTVRIVERKVNLQYEGSRWVAENESTLRAKTTLAPGTTVNVTARDEELRPFRMPRTATVTGNRTFAVSFDFRDFEPGREFELRLRDQGDVHDAVVGPVPTETPEPTTTEAPNTTTAPETTTAPPETTTETTAPDTTKEGLTQVSDSGDEGPLTQRTLVEGSAGGSVPGFDGLLGVVAVVAAGLLAFRRS